MNTGISTNFIIEVKEMGMDLTEIVNLTTGTVLVLFTRPKQMMPLMTFTVMSGGLFRFTENICLPPSIVRSVPKRMENEEEALNTLRTIITLLKEWEL
ncbi:hypothetical protein [Citrobacter sp. Igbk 16]|uniref:hypothetical protein n=1 Tax=Citrobacter sp. Igbk 16 TaxID=2963958 RepID=UPI0023032559|nr:hypothetical protein [Citrobacter sp. Igbk 16]MDA8518980.1 hypothetical protein [Citrobacter sp. Igbk 16]